MSGPAKRGRLEARRGWAGVWGAMSGPRKLAGSRGALRLGRGAASVGGVGGHVGAPTSMDEPVAQLVGLDHLREA
jgi:hypothetical protein